MADETFAALALPLARPVAELVDLDALDAVTRLAMPAVGSARIHVVGSDGAPYRGRALVRIAVDGAHTTSHDYFHEAHGATTDGDVVLPHIGVGLRLMVTATPADESLFPERVAIDGPGTSGEVVDVTLEVGRPRCSVAGVLVARDGSPLARSGLRVAAGAAPESAGGLSESVTTDDAGRFRWSPADDLLQRSDCTLWLADAAFPSGEQARRLARAKPGEVIDVGRVCRVER